MNVLVSDTLRSELSYISGSWEANNSPAALAATGQYTVEIPALQAYFPVIDVSINASNPLLLRYQAVVNVNVPVGTIITNTAETQWTSLPTDPYGDTRTGAGGVDDYRTSGQAQISLDQFTVFKTGPLTVTAGSAVTYVITVTNGSPITGTNARVVDTISFRVTEVTGTFSTPLSAGLCGAPTPVTRGSEIACLLGDLPPYAQGVVTITGRIAPDAPDGALVDDYADYYITDSNGVEQERTDEAETQVETSTDLMIEKSGPATASAGELITYTLVVTNAGPSTARGVDAKDILPAGLTFVSGSTTQGACASSICQIGDMEPGGVVTMVITASVGSDVTGVITNTGQVFSATDDNDQSNNRDTATTTVAAYAALYVAKVDMTDPVYAGNTYFYQVSVTNTGPAQANNVVITDILPAHVVFEGASPGCSYAAGRVTCAAGDLAPGEWFGALINVRVPVTISDNTLVTNTATISTTSNIVEASSILTATEPTLLRQTTNNPTDLAISKRVAPAQATAGLTDGNIITYTLAITNNGPAAATAVQVTDLYPPQFVLLSATTSKPITEAYCSVGGVCDLGEMAIGASAVVTLVLAVPADAAGGVYTNTAHVGSASPDTDLSNNTADIPVTVLNSAALQVRKVANPTTATAGQPLAYTILVTNTGPSDAANVTVAETLPTGFSLSSVVPSQGGCAAFPCNLGAIPAGGHATIFVYGAVGADVTDTLTNTVGVTSTTPGTSATFTLTTPISGTADLALVKTATATARPGDPIVYTLTVYNLGPSAAQSVRITDTLPISVSFGSASAGCTESSGVVVCTLTGLAAGASSSFMITTTASASLQPGTSLENSAAVGSSTTDGNASNNAATADTSIVGAADLVTSKVGSPASVIAGEYVTYTIRITNAGPGLARSVDVKDQLPAGLSLASISASDGGVCGGAVCQFGALPAGATRTITVVARVNPDAPAGTVTNTAAVYSTDESDQTNNTATADTTITTSADVSVRKVALSEPVGPTAGLLYELQVSNAGPSDAQDVVVTDTLDANVSFVSASAGCTLSSGAVVCAVGSLAAGATIKYLVAVQVADIASGTVLTNTVAATTATTDPNSVNNTATITTTVQQPTGPSADLAIAKGTTLTGVTAGERITYTLTITNAGPAAATNVRVLELIPAGATVVSLTPANPDADGEYCNLGGACWLGTVYPTTTATIQVVLEVNPDFSGSSLINTAQVSADQADPDQGDNFASVTTPVSTAADLQVGKADLVDPAYAGDLILYQIVVTNSGPSAARAVVVTDTLPAGLSFVGASVFCSESGGVVTCQLGDLAAGASAAVLLQVRAATTLPTGSTVTNQVVVTSTIADPTPANNSASATTTVNQPVGGLVDLEVGKLGSATVVAGQNVTYTLVVTNAGPAVATDVSVVDALPVALTVVSVSASQGTCTTGVTCLLGDLAVNATAAITVVATVDPATPAGGLLNMARVASANPDADPTNNAASAGTIVTVDDTLGIQKVGPATVTPEGVLAYQIVVSNTGPSDATDVVISDTLPSELQNAIASASQGSCTIAGGLLTCTVGRLAVGGQAFIAVQGTVARSASGTLVNTARVTSAAAPTGVSSTASTTVLTAADLELVKRGPATAQPGATVVYTLTLRNLGPSTAAAVTLTDTLPTGLTFAAATAGCSNASGVVTCAVGSLAADTTVVYTVTATVDADVQPGASLENAAQVTTTAADPNPLNNAATADTSIVGAADLTISKVGSPETVNAGETVTYTIRITNSGPGLARSVDVKDQLPAGLEFVSATASDGGVCGGAVCQFGTLPAGATRTITVVARVNPDAPAGTVTNTAAVYATDESDPANNTATADTTVTTAADLSIGKTASPNPAVPGQGLTYQLTVYNAGPSDAQAVVVTDTLPAGFTATGVSSSQGACSALPCALGTLPAGGSATVTIVGTVATTVTASLVNLAGVTSGTPDPNPTNNAIRVTTPANPTADVGITLRSTPTTIAGQTATVIATVYNNGSADALGAVVTITLPPSTTFDSAALPPGWFAHDNGDGTVTITTTNPLPAGDAVGLPITVLVDPAVPTGTSLEFTAVVGASTPDSNPRNNAANTDTSVIARADLGLTKNGLPTTVLAGELITYTLVVRNFGPSNAAQVKLVDSLPAGLTLVSVAPGQGVCGGLICLLGDLMPGGLATVTVVARVNDDVDAGAILLNAAYASSDTTDPGPNPNIATTVNTAQTEASLQIDKQDLSDPVAPDAQLIYAIVVTNTGPSEARDVVVTDQLPAGAVFQGSSAGCVEVTTAVLSCPLGTLAAGSVTRFLVTVRVEAAVVSGTVLVNSVAVTSTTPLTRSVLSDTEPTTVRQAFGPPADLAVAKTASSAAVVAGGRITYTLVITNYGPATATDVELADTLPAGLTLISATPSQGACDNAGVCFLGSLIYAGAPSTATVLIVAEASPALAAGTILTNTVLVHADQPDDNPANNTDAEPVTVSATADLTIAKRGAPEPAVAGELLRYTIVVANNGPSAAEAVVVTDTLPAGVAFVSSPACTNPASDLVICPLGALAASATTSFEIVVAVAPTATGVLTNVAIVGSDTPDPNPLDNSAIHTDPLAARADLSIVKTASADQVVAGELFTYTLVARNTGPSAATDVVITDPLPSGVAFVSAAPPQASGPDPLTWRLAGLAVGETYTFTVLARAETGVAAGTLLRNTASIGAATPDPNPANNSDEAAVQTVAHASVTITKTASPDPAVAGQPLTYTITLHNGGPSTASRVDVKELLPQGLTLQQLIASQGVCVGQICQLGDLVVSRTVVITAVTIVDPNLPPGAPLCNTAAAVGNTPQPGGATGPITTTVCVPVTTSADLRIAKLASAAGIVAGELLTYTLVATNLGPSTAMSVSVTDALPAEVAFVSAQPAADAGPNPLIWNLGSLQVGETRLMTVTVRVNAWVTQTFTNTAGIVSATGDPNPDNNSRPRPVQPAARADLSLIKQAQGATARAGEPLTYTLIVRNAGPSDAVNVRVTDTLPAEVRFDAATPAPDSGPNPLIWDVGVLPAGASRIFTVNVTIASWVTQTFTNTAIVGSTTADPNPDDDRDAKPTTPVAVADLAITKVAEPSPAMPGRLLTYTLIVTNVGPADAVGVLVTDTLPGAVAFERSTPAPIGGPDPLVWSLGDMPARTSRTIELVVSVRPTATQTFSNTALVGSQTLDPDDSNNDDTTVSPVRFVDLQIAKSDGVGQALQGQTLTYTLVITNVGNATATGVIVSDRIPAHTTFVAADAGGILSGDTVVWPAFSLAPGAVATRTVTVQIASPLPESVTTIANAAAVHDDGAHGSDPTPDDNTTDDVDQMAAQVIVSKTDGGVIVEPGDTIIYTLTFTNTGSVAATQVVITETVPATTTFVMTASTPGWSCPDGSPAGASCTFALGDVPAGAGGVITFGVRVDSPLPVTLDAFILNAVRIGAGNQVDPAGPGTTDTITTPIGVPTGIIPVSFAATASADRITLRWSVADASGRGSFHLWRNVSGDRLSATRITAQAIPASAGQDGVFTFVDDTAGPGVEYAYWLQAFWSSGRMQEYGPIFARILPARGHRLWLPIITRQ